MAAEYEPSLFEPKWRQFWEEKKVFKVVGKPSGKKFYCLDMFPYPSGSGLHVGHPLGYTATDIYSRYKRMRGYSVLHPMGFDAFGLPAEQHAVSTGIHPSIVTKENCATFTKQLKLVGLSYDWDRNLATCTSDYYHWTQWIFLRLFNSWFDDKAQKARPIEELPIPEDVRAKGPRAISDFQSQYRLAYYSQANVNWCEALGTVLANEEVIDGKSERGGHEVTRKSMRQWMLRITKYVDRLISELDEIDWPENIKEQQRNWIGKRYGAEIVFNIKDSSQSLTAFTTRPDTLFGVTFFVISPEHSLVDAITTPAQKEAVAAYREQALRMSELNRTIENRKKTGVFTGSYVVNPINGESVPLFVGDYVLMTVGTGAVMGVPAHDDRDFEFARAFNIVIRPVITPEGQDAEIKRAVEEGERAWTESGVMLAGMGPLSDELSLTGMGNAEAGRKIVEWLAAHHCGRSVVNYKLRDWLFSRQKYWGEPIPIVHWEDGSITALSDNELPLELPKVDDFRPSEGGESPLAKAKDWLNVIDTATGLKGRRETNTMPQWAGSCWYYLRFIDPKNAHAPWSKELEQAWMPVDLYVGGAEHAVLHLLYARFWHKVLFDLGFVSTKEPFKKLFNQGMVLAPAFKNGRGALVPVDEVEEDQDGVAKHKVTGEILERLIAKMSKSLRNVVNLDDIISQYGADTFRMYLMFMGPLDVSRSWDSRAISGVNRFLRKVWAYCTGPSDNIRSFVTEAQEPLEVTKSLHRLIKRVTDDIEGLRFNTAIAGMMEHMNLVGGMPVSQASLEKLLLVMGPFAPHLVEEIWSRLGHEKTFAYEAWPAFDEKYLSDDSATVVVQINGKKRATVTVSTSITEDELRTKVLAEMASTNYKIEPSDQFFIVYQAGTKVPKLVSVVKK